MTRYEKDLRETKKGNGIEVLRERKAELDGLHQRLKECKNSFRAMCIRREIDKLSKEYAKISGRT